MVHLTFQFQKACIDECDDIAELLVEYGAYIDAEDRELWTPLHASAACGNFSMVEYLVDHGASVVALNSDGNLPVDLLEDDEDLKDYLLKEMDKHGKCCLCLTLALRFCMIRNINFTVVAVQTGLECHL